MVIKQLSVFIENREGRLENVTEVLKENNINIISVSLADTTEYGIFRLIVSDPKKAKDVLKQAGLSAMLTDVLAVKLPHKIGMLHDLLNVLVDVNIEYMYALSTGQDSSMILKPSNLEKAITALSNGGFELYTEEDTFNINR